MVEFGFGALGEDKSYPDSATGKTTLTLTDQWAAYSVDVAGMDLSTIKTGFMWVVAGQGKPVTFYIDDVVYE